MRDWARSKDALQHAEATQPGVAVLGSGSFSTPMDPIADEMVALFDAIAGSPRWKQT